MAMDNFAQPNWPLRDDRVRMMSRSLKWSLEHKVILAYLNSLEIIDTQTQSVREANNRTLRMCEVAQVLLLDQPKVIIEYCNSLWTELVHIFSDDVVDVDYREYDSFLQRNVRSKIIEVIQQNHTEALLSPVAWIRALAQQIYTAHDKLTC